jgi:hypothetical protein
MTIEQVAAVTKLNPHFIEALEEGRWDLLPGRVYLKSFAKVYAEALGIDGREVYEQIDGKSEDEKTTVNPVTVPEFSASAEKKLDYKLPIVLATVALVVILIIVVVRSRKAEAPGADDEMYIPARGLMRRAEIRWDRPWEKPASDPYFFSRERFTLEATEAEVRALIVADEDTVFKDALPVGSIKAFTADSTFRITLSRNDKIAGYFNGIKVAEIGSGGKKLNNFLIRNPAEAASDLEPSGGDTTGNEAQ